LKAEISAAQEESEERARRSWFDLAILLDALGAFALSSDDLAVLKGMMLSINKS
jgi:hypothetical protein